MDPVLFASMRFDPCASYKTVTSVIFYSNAIPLWTVMSVTTCSSEILEAQ